MTRARGRRQVDHREIAALATQLPGTWVLAGSYGSNYGAKAVALRVRTADYSRAYLPAGAYEARTELTEEGADLYVRRVPAPQPEEGRPA
ncbi:hypothetical protein AB0M87_04740 [Streptomyces sp. NPDC051320]|uniref:hypothetical protein n=1 Tax=Streptomyces sp. NPDC051320 TaxID=3154644 RepID=UPI00341DD57C